MNTLPTAPTAPALPHRLVAQRGKGQGSWRAHLGLLEEVGASRVQHSRATLSDHLVGVAEILERWGAGDDIVTAGLFHSIYGTDIFSHATLSVLERSRLRDAIGLRAERFAYLFCTLSRDTIVRSVRTRRPPATQTQSVGEGEEGRLDDEDLHALAHVFWANELEQRERLQPPSSAHRARERQAFVESSAWLTAKARAELESALAISETAPDDARYPRLRALLNVPRAEDFLGEGWHERLHLAEGSVARLDGLCDHSFAELCGMRAGYTRAFFQTRSGRVQSFDLRAGQETIAYESGATIYFHGLEHPRIGEWVSALDEELGLVRGLTRVSAFASLNGKGLSTHYDLNDNFVCQAKGTKRWRIAPNTHVRFPLYGYTIGRTVQPVHRAEAPAGLPAEMPSNYRFVDMKPGDVMFMPRGTWHDTETTDDASLHFNIQCGLPTWRDLIDFVISRTPLSCGAELRAPAFDLFGEDGVLAPSSMLDIASKLDSVLSAIRAGEARAFVEEFHRYVALRRTRLFEYAF